MIMDVCFRKPAERYEWLVKQYEVIKSSEEADILEKFIPREDISLVFHFGTPPCMLNPDIGTLPSYFIAPVTSVSKLMRVKASNKTFIVTCKPSVFSRTFNISMDSGNGIYVELPDKPFDSFWRGLTFHDNIDDWVSCFEDFIYEIIQGDYNPDYIDVFYDMITDPTQQKAITDIEGEFFVSPRTLQRQFIKRVGTSPKRLERIIRVNRVWESIKSGAGIDYQNIVYKGRYYDQSHFIREFKEITGETPDRFFKRDLSNVKIMSGKGYGGE